MKKVIFMLAVIAAFTFTSCKKDKTEEVETEVEAVDAVKQEAQEVLASNDVLHQCPMNCEKGKSYTEPGKCPICKMDLVEKKVDVEEETEVKKDSTGM
jgi:predicted Zn-ribbon and HTH transcriptional regulator